MAEYIEREALRNSVESIDWYSVYKGKLTAGAPNTENALYKANSIYEVINNAPAADVAPVRHGRWEPVIEGVWNLPTPVLVEWRCSQCGRTEQEKEPYCNCGAKMDEGDGNSAIA